jgi:hypothetical protein
MDCRFTEVPLATRDVQAQPFPRMPKVGAT